MPLRRLAPVAAAFAAALVLLSLALPPSASADHEPYKEGELFVSVGGGIMRRFDAQGQQTEDLDTETDSAEIGDMCFASGRMYSMNFQDGSISLFDGSGGLVESRWASSGEGLSGSPESCVLDSDGNLYVGFEAEPGGTLQKLNPGGDIIESYTPDSDISGADQIDLAADQCTMLYTSEGGTIKAFDVCDGDQLPDFATGLGSNCNNLRIRPNEEVLVACDSSVIRLSSSGEVIQQYDPADTGGRGNTGLFALNLDPDGQHFYTATYTEGLVWRVDIDSGEGVTEPYIQTVIEGDSIGGLAIFGEITVAFSGTVETDRPEIVRAVPDPTDISTEPDVVGTNVALAVVVAIVVLLSSQIFNETIDENNDQIESFARRYVRPFGAPLRAARSAWRGAFSSNPQFAQIAGVGVVLVATAVVYGFLEPGFKLDSDGIVLVLSVVVALGVTTYVYSGVEARVTERQYHIPSGIRVYPVAFAIAIVSVAVSRFLSFQPGVIYGFVASNVVLGATELDLKQKGRAVLLSAVALLAAFAVAWGLMIPFREWADSDDNVLAVLLEGSATLVAVGTLETLAFSMVPVEFTHGIKVWRYNRVAWFAFAVVLVFLFWHVLLVQDEAGFKAIESGSTLAALAVVGVCVGLTGAVWGYFYYRRRQAAKLPPGPPSVDGAAPPPSGPAPADAAPPPPADIAPAVPPPDVPPTDVLPEVEPPPDAPASDLPPKPDA